MSEESPRSGKDSTASEHGRSREKAQRYVDWLWRWRWFVLVAAALCIALLAQNIRHVTLASDYRIFFSDRNPELINYENLEHTYTKNDNIMFVIHNPQGTVYNAEILAAVWELTDQAWRIPHTRRVDSLTNHQHTEPDGDLLTVGDLVLRPSDLDAAAISRVEAAVTMGPELLGLLVSNDGTTTAVNARMQFSDNARAQIPEAATAAIALGEAFRGRYPDLELEISGFAMLSHAFAEAPKKDARSVLPLMYLLISVFLAIFFRSAGAVLITLLIVAASAAAAVGVAGMFRVPLNPVSGMAPNIILTVAVANCVHILTTVMERLRDGQRTRESIIEAVHANAKPVFLSALTTTIGFLSLNSSDAPPFWHLGNITAVGVVIAWILSMTVLPVVLNMAPPKARSGKASSRAISAMAEFVIARRRLIVPATAAITVVLLASTYRLEINDKPFEYFRPGETIREATEFTIDHLTGVYGISYSVESGETEGIASPAYLEKLDQFAEWLRAKPEVAHVSSVSDVIKRLNRDLNGGQEVYYSIPDTAEATAQYFLLFEMSLPYGLDLNDKIDVGRSASRLDVTFGDVDFVILNKIAAEADQWLATNGASAMQDDQATSQAIMFSHISERNISAMLEGTLLAFVAIALTLMLALKSVRLGLISLIPNALPIGLALGTWALLNGRVNMAITIVASVSIGIIVDDTVHFLTKYHSARMHKHLPPEDAIRYAYANVGRALIITSVVIATGFSMLTLSPFFINFILGLMTAITVLFALALDLLLLPALLLLTDKDESQNKS